jgi:hypothetical protein
MYVHAHLHKVGEELPRQLVGGVTPKARDDVPGQVDGPVLCVWSEGKHKECECKELMMSSGWYRDLSGFGVETGRYGVLQESGQDEQMLCIS